MSDPLGFQSVDVPEMGLAKKAPLTPDEFDAFAADVTTIVDRAAPIDPLDVHPWNLSLTPEQLEECRRRVIERIVDPPAPTV